MPLIRKTVSEKQLAANRANARKSQGPVTVEGKRRSAGNRRTHGLFATTVMVEGESPRLIAGFIADLEENLAPQNDLERFLIRKMAAAGWRQQRLWAVESASITHEIQQQQPTVTTDDPGIRTMLAIRNLADKSRHLDLVSRCEHRFDRQFNHSLNRYLEIRQQRAGQNPNAGAVRSHHVDQNKQAA